MENLLWIGIQGVNSLLSWLSVLLEGIMPGREVHFWALGFLGMFYFFVTYFMVKLLRKIPFGDTVLAFLMALSFLSATVMATGLDDVSMQIGTNILSEGAAGLTGFFILFLLYSLAAAIIYTSVKAVRKAVRKKREEELIE